MRTIRKKSLKVILVLSALFLVITAFKLQQKPVLYIIGDSTVRNPTPPAGSWGQFIGNYFDTTRISISNQAIAGRSTRTFVKEGRWDRIMATLKRGDYLIMQFGHNEGSVPDTSRGGYRGVLKGTGEEVKELIWADGKPETVHTYGWYLRKFTTEARAKGATVMIASMIPRNDWKDGKVDRADKDYGLWALQVATQTGAHFIDLNKITADKYDKMGPDIVKYFFPYDHTHTNLEGAAINAGSVVIGIKMDTTNTLNKYFAGKPFK